MWCIRQGDVLACVLVVAVPACGPEVDVEPDPPTGPEVVDEELEPARPLRDCGEAHIGLGECGEVPPPDADAMLTCIIDGWMTCKPSVGVLYTTSDEGIASPDTFAVVPDDAGGCKLAHFVDWTEDPYGGCKLRRSECAPYDGTMYPVCPWLIPQTCTAFETVLDLEKC